MYITMHGSCNLHWVLDKHILIYICRTHTCMHHRLKKGQKIALTLNFRKRPKFPTIGLGLGPGIPTSTKKRSGLWIYLQIYRQASNPSLILRWNMKISAWHVGLLLQHELLAVLSLCFVKLSCHHKMYYWGLVLIYQSITSQGQLHYITKLTLLLMTTTGMLAWWCGHKPTGTHYSCLHLLDLTYLSTVYTVFC